MNEMDEMTLCMQKIINKLHNDRKRITALESLLREMVDEPPIVVGDGGACCVFCGAVYDNPHMEACWVKRAEKALSGEE
jgi:hypothetical protein